MSASDWTDQDIAEIAALRRFLHANPELSGEERATAETIARNLSATGADRLLTGIGGHGVAAVYEGGVDGPTILLRSELDALPIEETGALAHRSRVPGKAHLCGHDGHAATLVLVGRALGRRRPAKGRIVLMFQPAEENGSGARAVISDPAFASIAPDLSLAWHNLPGLAFGAVALGEGPVNCASRGLRIRLSGRTAHASEPEKAVSPRRAVAALIETLPELSGGTPLGEEFALVTVTHARLGEPAFGITPGEAEVWATLRTLIDERMDELVARAEAMARAEASDGLRLAIEYQDIFATVRNAPEAVRQLERALAAEGLPHSRALLPMRASEDFGLFGRAAPAAMFFVGAGEDHANLHSPAYDFPDALSPLAARVMLRAARQLTG